MEHLKLLSLVSIVALFYSSASVALYVNLWLPSKLSEVDSSRCGSYVFASNSSTNVINNLPLECCSRLTIAQIKEVNKFQLGHFLKMDCIAAINDQFNDIEEYYTLCETRNDGYLPFALIKNLKPHTLKQISSDTEKNTKIMRVLSKGPNCDLLDLRSVRSTEDYNHFCKYQSVITDENCLFKRACLQKMTRNSFPSKGTLKLPSFDTRDSLSRHFFTVETSSAILTEINDFNFKMLSLQSRLELYTLPSYFSQHPSLIRQMNKTTVIEFFNAVDQSRCKTFNDWIRYLAGSKMVIGIDVQNKSLIPTNEDLLVLDRYNRDVLVTDLVNFIINETLIQNADTLRKKGILPPLQDNSWLSWSSWKAYFGYNSTSGSTTPETSSSTTATTIPMNPPSLKEVKNSASYVGFPLIYCLSFSLASVFILFQSL